jgi:hypothetical protein
MLDVYYEDYDTEVSHSAISQKFSYNNTTSPAPITGYKVYFNNSTGEMSIDWNCEDFTVDTSTCIKTNAPEKN